MAQALQQQLAEKFGFPEFKNGQQAVIEHALQGNSTLAIFPTGSGKSLCYQFTALRLPHLTLLVSPLLALMQDQLAFLRAKNICAEKIDSTLDYAQQRQIMADARAGKLSILMVSVERFKNEGFRQFIQSIDVSMLVIDEAHCISEWGHNFRPDYLKLPNYMQQLAIPRAMLLTATATPAVKRDMADKFQIRNEHIVQTGFYRSNLSLHMQAAAQQDKPDQLLNFVKQARGAGIVYVTLQQQAQTVADYLAAQGIRAACYHAGLSDDNRLNVQNNFMSDRLDVVVATIAFGMGVDKANIRFVVHYELPKSIESYSQEIGRAGRDGLASDCLMLANLENLARIENFVYADTPSSQSINRVIERIISDKQDKRWEMQLVPLSNLTDVRQLALKTLIVQLELRGVLTPIFSYFSHIRFRFIQSEQQILAQFEGERRQFVEALFAHSEMKKTWATLDQSKLAQAYPHQRSRLISALDYLHDQGWLEVQRQRNTEVFAVSVEPDQIEQLVAHLTSYFESKEVSEIERIGELLAFVESNECLSRRLSGYFDDHLLSTDCGHCSVCLSGPINLAPPQAQTTPTTEQLQSMKTMLQQRLLDKLGIELDDALFCRFLAGITTPFLTQIKAKSLNGFGLCSNVRFAQIKSMVGAI